nr:MAG TPA: hypothetical protein [Caudoviricetes sp.]
MPKGCRKNQQAQLVKAAFPFYPIIRNPGAKVNHPPPKIHKSVQ